MQSITSTARLKEEIRLLEYKQAVQAQLLKEQFNLARESLKPVNIIKSFFNELLSSSDLRKIVFTSSAGLISGYFSKKIVAGSSINQLKRLFGNIIQVCAACIITRNVDIIKLLGQDIMHRLFRNKD